MMPLGCVAFVISTLIAPTSASVLCGALETACWNTCGTPLIFPFRCTTAVDGGVAACEVPENCQCSVPVSLRTNQPPAGFSIPTHCAQRTCQDADLQPFYSHGLTVGSTLWCTACALNCGSATTTESCIEKQGFCRSTLVCGSRQMCARWRYAMSHNTSETTPTPTNMPTVLPTATPTNHPTYNPTNRPTRNPTTHPTHQPTTQPTDIPTIAPSVTPTLQSISATVTSEKPILNSTSSIGTVATSSTTTVVVKPVAVEPKTQSPSTDDVSGTDALFPTFAIGLTFFTVAVA